MARSGWYRSLAAVAWLAWLAGCGGGDGEVDAAIPDAAAPDAMADAAPFDGPARFVFDQLLLPTTASQAMRFGLVLDQNAQARPNNALGQIFATLCNAGDLDLQPASDRAVIRGEIIELVELQTSSLVTAADPVAYFGLGEDPDPAACADSFDGVCGHHLDGSASFGVVADPPPGPLAGQLVAGKLVAGPGTVPLEISLFPDTKLPLLLYGARTEIALVSATGMTDGRLGGAIRLDDLDQTVLPELQQSIAFSIDRDCTGDPVDCPGTDCRPCGCGDGSLGRVLLDLFDEYGAVVDDDPDCVVGYDEFLDNSLISSLLAPDVDLFDCTGDLELSDCPFSPRTDGIKDSLSLGLGFSAVNAGFTLPE